MVKFISDRNCYSSQIEGSGLTLRVGYSFWGLYPNDKTILSLKRKQSRFVRLFPKLEIKINSHTGQNGVVCFFAINGLGWYSRKEYRQY